VVVAISAYSPFSCFSPRSRKLSSRLVPLICSKIGFTTVLRRMKITLPATECSLLSGDNEGGRWPTGLTRESALFKAWHRGRFVISGWNSVGTPEKANCRLDAKEANERQEGRSQEYLYSDQ
jgi:hypothetical protein